MTIFQIECFLAVAEHLNFAKAAEQLNVSQPAITRQIRTLEEELNTQLFIRNTRWVRLTENGRIFQSDAQVMATAARRSIQRFAKKDESNIIDFPHRLRQSTSYRIIIQHTCQTAAGLSHTSS